MYLLLDFVAFEFFAVLYLNASVSHNIVLFLRKADAIKLPDCPECLLQVLAHVLISQCELVEMGDFLLMIKIIKADEDSFGVKLGGQSRVRSRINNLLGITCGASRIITFLAQERRMGRLCWFHWIGLWFKLFD